MYVHTHMHMHTHSMKLHINKRAHANTYSRIEMHANNHAYEQFTHTCKHAHACLCVYACVYIHTYRNNHIITQHHQCAYT